jgi:STAS domain-containing protein
VLLIRRVSSPHVAFLGRIPGARRYSDLKRHVDNEPTPGVLAFRVESSIVYFNAEHILDTVLARLDAAREPIRLVICDLSTSPNIDMAGGRMFLALHTELLKRGIAFGLVEARSAVRDMLRVEGVEKRPAASTASRRSRTRSRIFKKEPLKEPLQIVTPTRDADACENIICLVPRCRNRIVPRHRLGIVFNLVLRLTAQLESRFWPVTWLVVRITWWLMTIHLVEIAV